MEYPAMLSQKKQLSNVKNFNTKNMIRTIYLTIS